MKIKEVVNEAWGFGYDPRTGQAKGVMGRLASDLVGADNYSATADYLNSHKNSQAQDAAAADINVASEVPEPSTGPTTKEQPKFLQQFELVHDNPPTVQYKNAVFQRDQYGKWVAFNSGKPAPARLVAMLDQVSPPAETTPGSELPAGAVASTPPAPKRSA